MTSVPSPRNKASKADMKWVLFAALSHPSLAAFGEVATSSELLETGLFADQAISLAITGTAFAGTRPMGAAFQ